MLKSLETQISSTPASDPPLKTKQSTLRLEQGVSDRLQDLGREQGICREVFIEALFEHCESDPVQLQAVLAIAKAKQEHRQQIANLRRAQSMMQRFALPE